MVYCLPPNHWHLIEEFIVLGSVYRHLPEDRTKSGNTHTRLIVGVFPLEIVLISVIIDFTGNDNWFYSVPQPPKSS